ncbi:MAG TPA: TonB-dependent receptor [Gemmatimonadaceae bacterium]
MGLIRACVALTLVAGALQAQEKPDLSSMSIDDLMNIEVTSVSRKSEKLSDTAAAVFVITQDDIRRSGATSIPELLRMVPGLDVARINGNIWAISARGFNGQFANKLLVMIDGRSVYSPLFSGVYWDAQDTMLEDVDRIEVVRGPGGTLWGANAVSGVVNIITKSAVETQGVLLSTAEGAAEGSSGAGRYGGSMGRNGSYRVFGKTFDRPTSVSGATGSHDSWTSGRAGFRADWVSRGGDNFTALGDVYRDTEGNRGAFNVANPLADLGSLNRVAGEDLQFRWTAVQSSRSDTALQAYYDYTARSRPGLTLGRHTLDVDFQQHLKFSGRTDVVWGAGYRNSTDRAAGPELSLVRSSNVTDIAGAFVQDEIQLAGRFHLTLGTKLQYERVTRLQLQPTVRLLFKASERQEVWAAVTSAVRTPSETELYGRVHVGSFPDGTANGGQIVLTGNPALAAERVTAYEVGYRWQAVPGVAFDATAFHNHLQDIVLTSTGRPFRDPSGRTIIPINFSNSVFGDSNGVEFLATDSVTADWNLALGYSFFQSAAAIGNTSTPHNQLQLRSVNHLSRTLELDSAAYYVGRIGNDVPAYLRLDAQILWRLTNRWELGISGQNLLRARHSEFLGTNGESQVVTPAQRMVNGKITWRF